MNIKNWLGEENKLGQDIWKNKYQYNNETFDEWLDRVSNGNEELKQLIIDKKFLFGGRILSNRGINNNSCMSNCFVIPAPKDSIESIFDTAKKSARVFSFGGGVGFDISNLRPNGMKVNNSAKTTTGAVSFMDLYSLTTEIIGQNNRKGALMLTMEIDHPDIEEFIDIKKDLDRVTKANISVKVNDKFMEAVKNNKDWELKFITEHGDILKKNVNARKIFRKLCENNHEMGEPGCLCNDRIQNYNLTNGYENYNITSTNPCFTGDMKLLTKDGYKSLKELCNTNFLMYSYNGEITNGKVWCNGEKDTIELTFSNGKKITCTQDHKFMTIDGEECKARDLKNKKIMPKIYKTVENDELYIKLGFIQGDGQLSRLNSEYHDGLEVNLGVKDGDVRYLFEKDKYSDKSHREIYLQGYNKLLEELQFSHETLSNRIFPKTYNEWTFSQKSNFLQGCFSANGCVNSNRRISYKTTCKEFALELMNTLEKDFGITSNLTINKKHKVEFDNGKYECRESYDVNINKYNDILLFAQFIGFYQNYKKIKLNKLIEIRVPYVRNIKENGKELVYDFNEPKNHWGIIEGYVAHNCGEQPLSENSSCLLSSLNLSEFVLNPFTTDSKFDYESFIKAIKVVVRAMNEVLDENIYRLPLKEQQEQSKLWRQVGIGIMGLSDTFIKLGFTYGDEQSLKFSEDLGNIFINECIKQSSLLAKEQGVFPNYNYYSLLKSKLYNDVICDEVKEIVKENGLRNVSLTSIAPTGSIGTMLGTSTGIEPNFRFSYNRKTESLGDGDKYFKVDSQIVKDYKRVTNDNSDNLPNYFIESQDISYINRIKMQSVWQKYIDTGISSTINLPNDATVEDIEKIYMEAWKYGLKGVTCFRDGCKRIGILTTNESKIEGELHRGEYEKKPDNLIEVTRKIYSGCGKMMLHISIIPKEKRIFDVYVTNSSAGGCALNIQNIAISISNGLRHGSTLASYKKSFEGAGKCSSYATARAKGKYVSKGNSCGTSILYTLLDVEKELQNECLPELVGLGYYKTNRTITEEENKFTNEEKELIKKYGEDWFAINFRKCPICSSELDSTGNCVSCPNCSYTKCE